MARTGIYAIHDRVANLISGGLFLHKHEAAAIRFFNDILTDEQTIVAKHPDDFELILVGYLDQDTGWLYGRETDEQHERIVVPTIVLTGSQWVTMHKINKEKAANARA